MRADLAAESGRRRSWVGEPGSEIEFRRVWVGEVEAEGAAEKEGGEVEKRSASGEVGAEGLAIWKSIGVAEEAPVGCSESAGEGSM